MEKIEVHAKLSMETLKRIERVADFKGCNQADAIAWMSYVCDILIDAEYNGEKILVGDDRLVLE